MAQITFTNTGGITSTGAISGAKGAFTDGSNAQTSQILSVISTLSGSTASYTAEFLAPNITTGGRNILTFGKGKTSGDCAFLGFNYEGQESTGNLFRIGFWSKGDKLVVNADGKVGVGTTAPSYNLDVVGDTRNQSKTYIGSAGAYMQYTAATESIDFNFA